MSTTISSVARIAYLSSDVLVHAQSASSSVFVAKYTELSASSFRRPSILLSVPAGGDPVSSLLRNGPSASLLSFTSQATSHIVTTFVLRAAELSVLPLVLHLAVEDDLSDVLVLRSAVPFFLVSYSSQQAHDHAVLASRLARQTQRAVVHVFYQGGEGPIDEIAEDTISRFIRDVIPSTTLPGSKPYANGVSTIPNKHKTNGHADTANGSNGHANGIDPASSTSSTPDVTASPPSSSLSEELFNSYKHAASQTSTLLGRSIVPFMQHDFASASSPSQAESEIDTVILVLGDVGARLSELGSLKSDSSSISLATLSLLSPFSPNLFLTALLPSARHVILLEQVKRWNAKWTSVYLDVMVAVHQHITQSAQTKRPSVRSVWFSDPNDISSASLSKVIFSLPSPTSRSSAPIRISSSSAAVTTSLATNGSAKTSASLSDPRHVRIPRHESSYFKILAHLFGDSLDIVNAPSSSETESVITSPEYALGRVRGQVETREELVRCVEEVLGGDRLTDENKELRRLMIEWLKYKDDREKSRSLGKEIVESLQSSQSSTDSGSLQRIYALRAHLPARSRWIIGSDAWSYDLGASGLHHAIASQMNINVLVIDSGLYSGGDRSSLPSGNASLAGGKSTSAKASSSTAPGDTSKPAASVFTSDPHRRKQDIGLYAMNHGDVYVASVAVYSSYSQVLQAFIEADKHLGPSVVLGYLPYGAEFDNDSDSVSALSVLKETKRAVDAGYWPLYRWNPSRSSTGEPFTLDSDILKVELEHFLDRENHLSQLTLAPSHQHLATELVSTLSSTVQEARRARARRAYEEMVSALARAAPPVRVLYASDGGTAEKFAKRLAARGRARGVETSVGTMDSIVGGIEGLVNESGEQETEEIHVVFVTSVAGQGEPPQNGRGLFKALNAAAAGFAGQTGAKKPLKKLRYSVFGMGDSHYWPRPEDAHYYNRPGKDLDARLAELGGQRFADLGLGDDQDADGPETGYKVWEPLLWKALGVDSVEIQEAEPEPITNEHIKAASSYLRGTIAEGLEDTSTGALAPSDTQLTKFHGIYQQDDRDIRDERTAQGFEPAYSFMIRVRMPGGVCKPDQWLMMDRIADERGNGTFKITTRQTFQFHGVLKGHLREAIRSINKVLLDTLAACGDVNRNVICSAIPGLSKLHGQVYEFAKRVSGHLLPRTTAYHEIWLDKKMVAGDAVKDFEPLYGEFYLPRKFKIAVAVPPTNDVDIFANDLGFIAIVENGELAGFNVAIGGGMGVTHGNKKTYPRLGDVIGFCTAEQGPVVAEKIMLTQRDNGNRADRKNARLKYTIDRMGLGVFTAEVESRLGFTLAPARPYTFDRNVDDFGWATGENGKHHFTLFIENGRIQDEPGRDFKKGLRAIAKIHRGVFRLTANQHLVIADIEPEDVPEIKRLLAEYKLDNLNFSGLRLSSSACVAFPTCGLAMAESERYLPILIDKVEKICEENGLRNDSIVMRMTGCPNGCARPYVAEVAFVGKAPGVYAMLLGGGYHGQRLNKIYRETVAEPEILAILTPMIKRYALERLDGERFGDFVIRAGYISPTTEGRAWYEGMGGEGTHREIVI